MISRDLAARLAPLRRAASATLLPAHRRFVPTAYKHSQRFPLYGNTIRATDMANVKIVKYFVFSPTNLFMGLSGGATILVSE